MPNLITGAQPPGGPVVPVYDVVGAPSDGVLDLQILCERILGVDAHWWVPSDGGRPHSVRCYAESGDCQYCGSHRRLWLAFVGAIDLTRRVRIVLRMGKETSGRLVALAERYGGLRGVRVLAERVKSSATASLTFRLHDSPIIGRTPQAHDITASVCKVLGCRDLPDYRYSADELPAEEGGGL